MHIQTNTIIPSENTLSHASWQISHAHTCIFSTNNTHCRAHSLTIPFQHLHMQPSCHVPPISPINTHSFILIGRSFIHNRNWSLGAVPFTNSIHSIHTLIHCRNVDHQTILVPCSPLQSKHHPSISTTPQTIHTIKLSLDLVLQRRGR